MPHLKVVSTLISSIFANLSAMVGTAMLVRHLGGEDFGKVALLTTAASAISIVPSSGIGLHVVRSGALAQDTQEHGDLIRASIWLSQGVAVLIGLGIIAVGGIFSDRSVLELVSVVIILHLFTADSIHKSAMIGTQRVNALALSTVVGTTSSVACQLAGAFLWGPVGFLGGFLAGTAVQALSSRLGCGQTLMGSAFNRRAFLAKITMTDSRNFIGLATLSASVVPLSHWLASLIAATKAIQYSDVAQIAVAMQFFNLVLFIPTVLNKLVLPRAIRRHRDSKSQRTIVWDTLQQIGWYLLLIPMFPLLAWTFSTQITQIYNLQEAVMPIVLYFMWASVVATCAIPVSNYFISQSYMGFGLISNIAWATVYLGGAIILPGGAKAVAISLLAAYTVNLFIGFLFLLLKGLRCD